MELSPMHPTHGFAGGGERVHAHASTPATDDTAAAVTAAGPWLVTSVCALVVIRAASRTSGSLVDDAVGIPLVAAMGIAISVMRWAPRTDEIAVRRVSSRQTTLLLGAFLVLAAVSVGASDRADALFGPMVTCGLIGVYLACWGFRSLFLLRRVTLLSLLTWQPLAEGTHTVVRRSIAQASDLIYRRLSSLPFIRIEDHPWRLFSAMTHRGVLVMVGTVLFATVMTRRRLSLSSLATMTVAAFTATLVHHAVVVVTPIERVDPALWIHLITGPLFEIVVAAVAGMTAVAIAHLDRQTTDHLVSTASVDRDPVIFAVGGRAMPGAALTLCGAIVPVVGLLAVFGTVR